MWLGTRQQLANLTISQLEISASILDIGDRATDLGVLLDGQLSMALHAAVVCRSSYYQMRQLWSIKRSVTTHALQALVQVFVHCRLDYCNALLAGVADVHLKRLHAVSTECRSFTRIRISPLRSHYASPRTSALVAGSSTNHLQDGDTGVESSAWCSSSVFVGLLCSSGHGVRSVKQHLRSATAGDLMVPRARTTTGQRSFAVNGPTVWNSLPAALRAPDRWRGSSII